MLDSQSALLPVLSVNICGPNGIHKRGTVLLDTGAQISLIRNDTASQLGLTGKDMSVTITKVGGQEETLKTKEYRVPVTSLKNQKKYSVKAVGIPSISEDIAGIQIAQFLAPLGLMRERIHRGKGPVDLLIGIDHASMHTGQTRQAGKLVARHTPCENCMHDFMFIEL